MADHLTRHKAKKQDAYDRGYKAGYSTGHREGYNAMLRAVKEYAKMDECYKGTDPLPFGPPTREEVARVICAPHGSAYIAADAIITLFRKR